jgi:hypothetical protein
VDNLPPPPGTQPFYIAGQTVSPQVNAAPLYLPNLIAAIIASAGVVVGSIAPWATFLAFSRNAVGGDGTITLILGLVAGAALFAVLTRSGSGEREPRLRELLDPARRTVLVAHENRCVRAFWCVHSD